MKKIIKLFRAWKSGEEVTAEITLGLPEIALITGVIVILIIGLIKCL